MFYQNQKLVKTIQEKWTHIQPTPQIWLRKPLTHAITLALIIGSMPMSGWASNSITATLAADNYFALYYGTKNKVTFIDNDSGWSTTHKYTFTPTTKDYIYVVGWSDYSAAQGFLGEFTADNTILTGDSRWQVYPTKVPLQGTTPPSTDNLLAQIKKADEQNGWLPTAIASKNGMLPWDKIEGVSDDSKWIWHQSGKCPGQSSPLIGSCNHDEYLIFRLPVSELVKPGEEPRVDVWVSDPAPDDGSEPGKATHIWASPDIWVRNEDDGGNSYQNVKYGQDNYVYVNVRNRGTLLAENTKVELYRSGASMGQSWPRGWALVGTGEIASLAPQASEIVKIKWEKDNIPKPGHYCFYARLLNDEDPMFSPETTDMVQNTRVNNNVAWRNFNVVGLLTKVTDQFEVEVGNPTDMEALVKLVFDEPEKLLANNGAKAIVDLGETLFQRWQQAGGEGENIKALAGSEIELLATPAQLLGIPLKVGENLPITMRVDATQPMPGAGTSREYQFTAQEFINDELIGGVDYAITTRAQDTDSDGDGIKDVDDDDNDNDGIPDEWEVKFGLNPLGEADANEDLDGDGQSNLEEFKAGVDPTDPKSKVTYYSSSGVLKDKAGNPIAGVTIQIGNKTTTTDATGYWKIDGLPEGEYTVTANKDGYDFPTENVAIGNDQNMTLDMKGDSLLDIKVVPTPRVAQQGEPVTYAITITNQGEATATGVTLVDVLPENTEIVSIEALDGGQCETDTVSCNLPDLTPGATANVELVIANNQAETLVNSVTVSTQEYPGEVKKTWTQIMPYLSVTMTDSPDPVAMLNTLHYRLTMALNHRAPSDATGVTLVTQLPKGVTLESIDSDDGVCDTNALPQITCQMDDLSIATADSISQATVDMEVELKDAGLLVLTHEAKVTANEYPRIRNPRTHQYLHSRRDSSRHQPRDRHHRLHARRDQ
jgi:uncharacterized repeat protein (TIGR01451 family)